MLLRDALILRDVLILPVWFDVQKDRFLALNVMVQELSQENYHGKDDVRKG